MSKDDDKNKNVKIALANDGKWSEQRNQIAIKLANGVVRLLIHIL
jgi:hypothetical protein